MVHFHPHATTGLVPLAQGEEVGRVTFPRRGGAGPGPMHNPGHQQTGSNSRLAAEGLQVDK